eukprot:scaffold12966_cov24-Cyclotella_meneghiniana.AAC.2
MLLEDVMAIEQSIIQSEKIVWWWPLYDIRTSQDHKDDTRSRGDVMIVWGVDDLHLVRFQFDSANSPFQTKPSLGIVAERSLMEL